MIVVTNKLIEAEESTSQTVLAEMLREAMAKSDHPLICHGIVEQVEQNECELKMSKVNFTIR